MKSKWPFTRAYLLIGDDTKKSACAERKMERSDAFTVIDSFLHLEPV